MSFIAEFIDELTDIIALLTVECADNIVVCGDLARVLYPTRSTPASQLHSTRWDCQC